MAAPERIHHVAERVVATTAHELFAAADLEAMEAALGVGVRARSVEPPWRRVVAVADADGLLECAVHVVAAPGSGRHDGPRRLVLSLLAVDPADPRFAELAARLDTWADTLAARFGATGS